MSGILSTDAVLGTKITSEVVWYVAFHTLEAQVEDEYLRFPSLYLGPRCALSHDMVVSIPDVGCVPQSLPGGAARS